ncbi:cob(I)yrinic acid a,c-diamide adenosyltransferase [Candidatus Gottesmanbacteria bacterium]|nr:cob(I)yrinic acid a,c-diamide adenosyltransferase [Candidatus Gottesmanbacteria bacterium]
MKIYTKTGDRGQTSLYGGTRVSKSSLQIEAYGTIDELNSFIGLALSEIKQVDVEKFLLALQTDLMSIASYLAGYRKGNLNLELRVSEIEKVIDQMDVKLPPLKNFILPTGEKLGASLHVARSVSRRAERAVIRYFEAETKPNPNKDKIIIYLNRLSDFLFVLARFANHLASHPETIWKEIE